MQVLVWQERGAAEFLVLIQAYAILKCVCLNQDCNFNSYIKARKVNTFFQFLWVKALHLHKRWSVF